MVTTINIEMVAGNLVIINATTAEPIVGLVGNAVRMLLRKVDLTVDNYNQGYVIPIEDLKGIKITYTDVPTLDTIDEFILPQVMQDKLINMDYHYNKGITKTTVNNKQYIDNNTYNKIKELLGIQTLMAGEPFSKSSRIAISHNKIKDAIHTYFGISDNLVIRDITKYCDVLDLGNPSNNRVGMRIENLPTRVKIIVHHVQKIHVVDGCIDITGSEYYIHLVK